jgi:fructoselysine-6-P-deglycase FrlB-like protein
VNPELFLQDLREKPRVLRALADRLRSGNPWSALAERPERVVLLGMGSSTYAASAAAARLRSRGLVAVAELASSDLLPAWGDGCLVVAISASGESKETVAALDRLPDGAVLVALTNTPASRVARAATLSIDLAAEPELGGVACRTYQHTLALLLALEAWLLDEPLDGVIATILSAAAATEHLLATEGTWSPSLVRLLDGPAGVHIAAPARRIGSAQQAALMLREGPRRAAVACESGDWAHVDVYLTKNTDYRLLSFAGSAWDAGIEEWTGPRATTVVSVGGDFAGASAFTLRYPGDEDDDVRLLTEVLVAEVVAARLWLG